MEQDQEDEGKSPIVNFGQIDSKIEPNDEKSW